MRRLIVISIAIWCSSVALYANDSLPIIEVKADRTMIYPQRMELTGEESLMDLLQMMPELMIRGYEDLINGYNLRIDNCPLNGDTRLILSQMKAKDIAQLQVCDNTGVAKGTIGMGKVLDINMARPDTVKGMVEGQGSFGKNMEGIATANVLYGSQHTDLYANASYRYQQGHKEYVSLHMTNRFDDRNKLLSYLTQQYVEQPSAPTHKVMGRARYFHTFNSLGTELMVLGGYQYTTDPTVSTQLPMWVVELNTPFPVKGLNLMAGFEGDYSITRFHHADNKWNVFNHDAYLQLTYALPKWRFTAGHRVMIYHYHLVDSTAAQNHLDVRNNTNAAITYIPHFQHQIQLGYYRKFQNPDNLLLTLEECVINQIKLAYAFSRQTITVQAGASYYFIDGAENYTALDASVYWRSRWVTLTGGANLYIAKSQVFASLRVAPTAYLPRQWQIALQLIYYTPKSPIRELYSTPVYGCLSISKQIGSHWSLGVDWHDMFDSFCSEAKLNRHAANVKVQYRF